MDFKLKGLLVEKFNANSIPVKSANQADLDLSFRINSFSMKRAEYALDETGQTYEFQFVVSGNLTIIDNRSNTVYLSDFALGSSHSVITKDLDLTTIEAEDGKEQVLDNLSQLIAAKLTDSF